MTSENWSNRYSMDLGMISMNLKTWIRRHNKENPCIFTLDAQQYIYGLSTEISTHTFLTNYIVSELWETL